MQSRICSSRRFRALGGSARLDGPQQQLEGVGDGKPRFFRRMQFRYFLLDGAESSFEKAGQCRIATSTEETPETILYAKRALVSEDVNFGGRIHGSERERILLDC